MLTLILKAPANNDDRSISSDYFESIASVFKNADGEKIAVHTSGMWHGPAGIYLSMDFSTPVDVFFHNPELGQSEKFGPIGLGLSFSINKLNKPLNPSPIVSYTGRWEYGPSDPIPVIEQ